MRTLALPSVLLLLSTSCNSLEEFDTTDGEAFCGQITLGSAYRTGFSPRVQLRLRLDTSKIFREESPGTVSTFEAGSDGAEPKRLLDAAALRPFAPLAHDALSDLEFGDGRERNLIYAVSAAAPAAEAMLAIVSLRTDDSVEVRLIRPGQPWRTNRSPSRSVARCSACSCCASDRTFAVSDWRLLELAHRSVSPRTWNRKLL